MSLFPSPEDSSPAAFQNPVTLRRGATPWAVLRHEKISPRLCLWLHTHNGSAVNIPPRSAVHALHVPRDSPLTFCPAESTPPPSSSPFSFTVTHLLRQDLHLFTIKSLPGTYGYRVISHLIPLQHSPLIKSQRERCRVCASSDQAAVGAKTG